MYSTWAVQSLGDQPIEELVFKVFLQSMPDVFLTELCALQVAYCGD